MRVGYQLPPAPTAALGLVVVVVGILVGRFELAIVGLVLMAIAAVRLLTGWR